MTNFIFFVALDLSPHTQLRFKWISSERACEPAKDGPSDLSFLPSIVADLALLLIIFAGLFVLRRNGGATFGLTRLIWRQVRWRFSLVLVRLSLLNIFILKGLFWLVLGSAIEIPPLVSRGSLSSVLFLFIPYLRCRCSLCRI